MSGTAGFTASAEQLTRSSCIWIIKPDGGNEVAFTLKDISANSSILLYEVGKPAPLAILGPDSIDSSMNYAGNNFLAVFPVKNGSTVSFEWQMSGVHDDDESQLLDGFYSENVPRPLVQSYRNETGSFAVVANLDKKYEILLRISLTGRSDDESSQCLAGCDCLSADAFEVLPSGRLGRLVPDRLCMEDSYEILDVNPQVVIWGDFKVPETDVLSVFTAWFATGESGTTPTTTSAVETTKPPATTAPGFANAISTNKALVLLGLIALYLPFHRCTT